SDPHPSHDTAPSPPRPQLLPAPPSLSSFIFQPDRDTRYLHSFPTRRSSDLFFPKKMKTAVASPDIFHKTRGLVVSVSIFSVKNRSEEHTSELQSRGHLVCRLLLEKKKQIVKPAMMMIQLL